MTRAFVPTKREGSSKRTKLVLGIYLVFGAVDAVLGATYFFSKQFMSYHAEAVGASWNELDAGGRTLILALLKLAGGGWFALGVITIALAWVAFKTRNAVARFTLPAVAMLSWSGSFAATWGVYHVTGASTPWIPSLAMIGLALTALTIDAFWPTSAANKNATATRVLSKEQAMKILVYGAGNIGSLYAAKLKAVGHDVTIVARGSRLREIREQGILLHDFRNGQKSTTQVKAIDRLVPEDCYDLVLVILPRNSISETLPILAANQNTPSVMFFGNNASGTKEMTAALERSRVLLGFPGAAALPHNECIRYVILDSREQPTTIGELDGSDSSRIESIGAALESAGFPNAICPNMDAWLKTHVAEISPTANSLYMAGSEIEHLKRNRKALVLMFRAIREGYRVLSALGIPITPASHRIFRWIPMFLLVAITRRKLSDEAWRIKIGHALDARDEMKTIADEFRELARKSGVNTPAIDELRTYSRRSESKPAGNQVSASPELFDQRTVSKKRTPKTQGSDR